MRWAAIVVVAGLAGSALAGTDAIVTAPPKWRLDREKSATMNVADQGTKHFGSAPQIVVTEAYFPTEIGAALIVTRSSTTALPDGRDPAIAAALDELEGWTARNAPIADPIHFRKVLADDKLLEVTVGGRDASAEMRSMFRMIVAADATHVTTVTGLCLDRDDSNPEHIAACRAALATLDTGIAAGDRVALAFPAAVATAEPTATTPTTSTAQTSMGDGSKLKLPPITVPTEEPATDRRPIYIGLGLVVLAAVFWWNRRNRDGGGGNGDDGDGDDDLHAAANNEEKS